MAKVADTLTSDERLQVMADMLEELHRSGRNVIRLVTDNDEVLKVTIKSRGKLETKTN